MSHILYFISDIDEMYIKIGITKNLENRFRSLQSGCPLRLKILVSVDDCDSVIERRLHAYFARYWMHGEWFQYSRDMMRYVNKTIKSEYLDLSNIPELGVLLGIVGPQLRDISSRGSGDLHFHSRSEIMTALKDNAL